MVTGHRVCIEHVNFMTFGVYQRVYCCDGSKVCCFNQLSTIYVLHVARATYNVRVQCVNCDVCVRNILFFFCLRLLPKNGSLSSTSCIWLIFYVPNLAPARKGNSWWHQTTTTATMTMVMTSTIIWELDWVWVHRYRLMLRARDGERVVASPTLMSHLSPQIESLRIEDVIRVHFANKTCSAFVVIVIFIVQCTTPPLERWNSQQKVQPKEVNKK